MNAVERPTPWALPPDGFHFEVAEQGEWVIPAVGAGRCRYGKPACKKPAAASMMRTHHTKYGSQNVPWDYCADHLYGRWIEDGKVVGWRLAKVTA